MRELAIARIEAQQAGKEGTAPWMVGEQMKELCRREPENAELIAQDLENPSLSLEAAERKIKAYADAHRNGGFACVTPDAAEKILREFYGLRPTASRQEVGAAAPVARGKLLDIMDFMG